MCLFNPVKLSIANLRVARSACNPILRRRIYDALRLDQRVGRAAFSPEAAVELVMQTPLVHDLLGNTM